LFLRWSPKKNNNSKIGWTVELIYTITLHKKDLNILEQIKDYFGVGYITKHGLNTLQWKSGNSILRCTLIGFERNCRRFSNQLLLLNKFRRCQLRNLSNKINKPDNLSETVYLQNSKSLDPWFITGFVDGEGCFIVSITKNPRYKTGYDVRLWFSIGLNEKDKALLENIQSYFGVGKIYKHTQDTYSYRVQSVKDLQAIIVHFDKYPLITQKHADYQLFKRGDRGNKGFIESRSFRSVNCCFS